MEKLIERDLNPKHGRPLIPEQKDLQISGETETSDQWDKMNMGPVPVLVLEQ